MNDTEFEQKLVGWRADPRFVEIAGCHTSWNAAVAQYGVALYEAGETEPAIEAFEAACSREPVQANNWSNLGVALSDLGRDGEAVAALEKSLALNPAQPVVQFNLAQACSYSDHLDRAHAAFLAAAESPALAEEALTALGLMYMRHLQFEAAREAFQAALARYSHRAALHANLGAASFQLGDLGAAELAYRKAASLADNAGYQQNLSFIKLLQGLIRQLGKAAIVTYGAENPTAPLPDALKRAVFYLTAYGQFEAALDAARDWQRRDPADPEAAYLLAAIEGTQANRADPAYLVRHFDDHAARFDEKLLTYLQYRVPLQLGNLLAEKLGEDWRGDVLDLGCGVGLGGPRLRGHANRLVGVDLSPRMLERAAARQAYDELVLGDAETLPTLVEGPFDLVVATDVLIYFGDLVPVFAAIAAVLKPGGWLAVSLETMPGRHYFQMPNGRFKHARNYLEQVRRAHFSLVEMQEMTVRVEAGNPVPGSLLLFRKRV